MIDEEYEREHPFSDIALLNQTITSTATFIADNLQKHRFYSDYVYNAGVLEQVLYLLGGNRFRVQIEPIPDEFGSTFCWKISNRRKNPIRRK